MSIVVKEFGVTKNGEAVKQYEIENANGLKAVVLNYGAVLKELHVPDKDGNLRDVVWGYESLAGYEKESIPHFGGTIGRNSNRIANAQVVIDGITYPLDPNNNGNNLHGGYAGYDQRMWRGIIADDNKVEFLLKSPDGDQGFPGNAEICVSYKLTNDNELVITYTGKADKNTVLNMTNHSYFNLDGQESKSVLEQELWMNAVAYTPTDEKLIPTGEICPVDGTPMDFRTRKTIGADIKADFEPLNFAGGYDHNFVLGEHEEHEPVARLRSHESGIEMEIYTDQPGIQMYSACVLKNESGGKCGRTYEPFSACCFETQHFPDALNHSNFPSTILMAGEEYKTKTVYKFKNK